MKQTLKARAIEATKQERRDKLKKLARTLTYAAPGIGPFLNAIFLDHIPELRTEKAFKFLVTLAEELESVKAELKADWEHGEAFLIFLQKTIRIVVEEIHEEKIDALRNILVNSVLDRTPDTTKQEHMISLLSNLTTREIICLSAVFDPERHFESRGQRDKIRELSAKNERLEVMLNLMILKMSYGEARGILLTLHSKGFLKDKFVTTEARGCLRFNELPEALTDFGMDFCRFVSKRKET